jgi:hypothetical protein
VWANLFWLVFGLIMGAWFWGMIIKEHYVKKLVGYYKQVETLQKIVQRQDNRILDLIYNSNNLIANSISSLGNNNTSYVLKATDPKTGKTVILGSFSDYKSAKKAMEELKQIMKYDKYFIEKTTVAGPWNVAKEDK